jgi:hypothetical protein
VAGRNLLGGQETITRALTTVAGRRLVNVREAAKRLDIPTQSLYQARMRGTIVAATGSDVPEGVWFEEGELNRWAESRRENSRMAPIRKRRRQQNELRGRQQVLVASA